MEHRGRDELCKLERKSIYHEDVPGDQDFSDDKNNVSPNSKEALGHGGVIVLVLNSRDQSSV